MTYAYELPPGSRELDYQFEAANAAFDQWAGGTNSTLLVLPTGTGKTFIAAMIVQRAIQEMGWRTLFLAQRRKLIHQAANAFSSFGIVSAVEMADRKESAQSELIGEPEVVIATVQSLKGDRLRAQDPGRFDLIITDEAHHSTSDSHTDIFEWMPDARRAGITATADGSRKNLGSVYETVAYRLTLRRAIKTGALVRIVRRTVPVPIDLRAIKITAGDFNDAEVGARISADIEKLAYNISVNIGDRKTVVFTPDLASASGMASMLRSMGIPAKYVAGSAGPRGMPEAEKEAILKEFEDGAFQVIASCDLLSEGWDCPAVSCVVICRATQMRWKYVQMVGRGFRLFPGKENLLVLDFDWQTDEESKKLCTPVSLFAESYDEETTERAGGREAVPDGQDVDVLDELDESVGPKRFVRELVIEYTGKYAEKFAAIDCDPVGVGKILDIRIRKSQEMDPERNGGPATPAQIGMLRFLGVAHPEGMGKWGASKLIDKLKLRRRKSLGSFQQVRDLLAKGVIPDQARELTMREAAAVIAEISQKRGLIQGEFF